MVVNRINEVRTQPLPDVTDHAFFYQMPCNASFREASLLSEPSVHPPSLVPQPVQILANAGKSPLNPNAWRTNIALASAD